MYTYVPTYVNNKLVHRYSHIILCFLLQLTAVLYGSRYFMLRT